jgi:hypothetical protein
MLAAHPAEASAVDKHLVSAKACPAHASAQPRPLPYLPRRTVDLVHLLCDYGVKFRFLTTTIGVNPDYKNEAFYRSTLDADALRVKDLFERAAASGIEIERRSLSDGELCDLTRPPHDSLVMALVDRRYLYRPPPNSVSGFIEGCFSSLGIQGGYVGHYVLLTGFDASRDGYYIKDPAKPSEELFVHSEHLHAARRAHGTDEDLIIIPWDQPQGTETRKPLTDSATAAAG